MSLSVELDAPSLAASKALLSWSIPWIVKLQFVHILSLE